MTVHPRTVTTRVPGAFLLLAAAVLLFPLPAGAQDLTTALMEATFRISGPSAAANGAMSAGTVFFLGPPAGKSSARQPLIMVTAAHVLAGIAGDEAVLLLRKRMQDGEVRSFEHPIRIRDRGIPLWTGPPDADAAVLPLALPPEALVSRISPDLLATDEVFARYEIHPGDELLSLGYPYGLPANAAGFPILRSGKIASYPLIPARKHRTFLYDVQVHSGNSGGPVFFTASSRTYGGSHKVREIGFIAGLVSKQAIVQGRALELGAVVPAQFIREAVEGIPGAGWPK
jgi:hypothetical protein